MSKTVWTVTYQDAQIEALDAEQIRVFEIVKLQGFMLLNWLKNMIILICTKER